MAFRTCMSLDDSLDIDGPARITYAGRKGQQAVMIVEAPETTKISRGRSVAPRPAGAPAVSVVRVAAG